MEWPAEPLTTLLTSGAPLEAVGDMGVLAVSCELTSEATSVCSQLCPPPPSTCLPGGPGQRCAYLPSQPRRRVSRHRAEAARMASRGRSGCPGCRAIIPTPTGPRQLGERGFILTPSHPRLSPPTAHGHQSPAQQACFQVTGDDEHKVQALSELTEACGPPVSVWLIWADVT